MTGSHYIAGSRWGICPRCGFKKRVNTFRKEWTGFRVCPTCWDPKHPQEFVRGQADDQRVRDAAPEPTDVFLAASRPFPGH